MNYSLDDMVKCAAREIAYRKRTYPGWKKMPEQKKVWELGCMMQILVLLEHLKRKEDEKTNPSLPGSGEPPG